MGQHTGAREPGIQGLRGIATTLVFLNHFGYVFFASLDTHARDFFSSLSYLSLGSSTFVLIAAYFTYARFAHGADSSAVAYLKRRLFRILPLYWMILAAYIAFAFAADIHTKAPDDPYEAASLIGLNLTLMAPLVGVSQIIVSTWTLTFIVLVYVVVPLLVQMQERLSHWSWTPTALPIAFAAASIYAASFTHHATFGVLMAAGVLLYRVQQSGMFRRVIAWAGDLGTTAMLIVCAVFFRVVAIEAPRSNWGRLALGPSRILFVVAVGMFVAARFSETGFFNRLLRSGFLQWAGKISYSNYLGHGIALYLCKRVVAGFFGWDSFSPLVLCGTVVCCYAVSLCVAALIYRVLELPLTLAVAKRLAPASARPRDANDIAVPLLARPQS